MRWVATRWASSTQADPHEMRSIVAYMLASPATTCTNTFSSGKINLNVSLASVLKYLNVKLEKLPHAMRPKSLLDSVSVRWPCFRRLTQRNDEKITAPPVCVCACGVCDVRGAVDEKCDCCYEYVCSASAPALALPGISIYSGARGEFNAIKF